MAVTLRKANWLPIVLKFKATDIATRREFVAHEEVIDCFEMNGEILLSPEWYGKIKYGQLVKVLTRTGIEYKNVG